MNRALEPGLYWVKLHSAWHIARFSRSNSGAEWWVVPSEHRLYQASEFDEVGVLSNPAGSSLSARASVVDTREHSRQRAFTALVVIPAGS
jgi:hypothetical protein